MGIFDGEQIFMLKKGSRKKEGLHVHLWIVLAREVWGHPHTGGARLELLLVQHAVHLTGLAAGRSGAGPAARRTETSMTGVIPLVLDVDGYYL